MGLSLGPVLTKSERWVDLSLTITLGPTEKGTRRKTAAKGKVRHGLSKRECCRTESGACWTIVFATRRCLVVQMEYGLFLAETVHPSPQRYRTGRRR